MSAIMAEKFGMTVGIVTKRVLVFKVHDIIGFKIVKICAEVEI